MENILTALGLATSLGSGLINAKAMLDKIKQTFGSGDADTLVLKQHIVDLAEALVDAKGDQVAMKEALLALQQQLEISDRFDEVLARYELAKTPGGSIVFALKPKHAKAEPAHFLCVNCHSDREIGYLQSSGTLLCCSRCKNICNGDYNELIHSLNR